MAPHQRKPQESLPSSQLIRIPAKAAGAVPASPWAVSLLNLARGTKVIPHDKFMVTLPDTVKVTLRPTRKA
jgi:hypothetical protein